MTRSRLLADAEGLILDAECRLDLVKQLDPGREYLAQAIVDDAVRAYVTMKTAPRITARVRAQVAAYYTRASLLSQALNAPLQ